jgi:hypothetical protein
MFHVWICRPSHKSFQIVCIPLWYFLIDKFLLRRGNIRPWRGEKVLILLMEKISVRNQRKWRFIKLNARWNGEYWECCGDLDGGVWRIVEVLLNVKRFSRKVEWSLENLGAFNVLEIEKILGKKLEWGMGKNHKLLYIGSSRIIHQNSRRKRISLSSIHVRLSSLL